MHIAKLLAGAALVAAPLSLVSGQAATPADSSGNAHSGQWITAASAAAGAALFLAFTHSGQTTAANSGSLGLHAPITNAGGPGVPSGRLTPSPTGGSAPPNSGNPTPSDTTAIVTNPGPTDSTVVVGYSFPGTKEGPPMPTTQNGPKTMYRSAVTEASSTVPEPGTLALTATGIIGLLPLVRRRRR